MAYPTIRNSTSGRNVNNSSTVSVSLPYGHVQGDLLIIGISKDGSSTIGTPSGWTLMAQRSDSTASRLAVFYKVRGFTESNPSVNLGASEMCTWFSVAITKETWSGIPEISTAYGLGKTPNAPSLTASWGAKDNLWFAVHGWDYNYTSTTDPSGFTLLQYQNGYSTSAAGIRVHYMNSNVATVDPSEITLSTGSVWYAYTIVVKPTGAPFEVYANVDGTWRAAEEIYVNVDGVWKASTEVHINYANLWKKSS